MENTITEKLERFFSTFPIKEYKKADIVIRANTQPTGIFYIESDVVRSYYLSKEGTEVTLNMYKPHAFFPMSWAVTNTPNTHFFEAMTNIRTRCAPKESVLTFLKEEPDVMYDLLRRVYIGIEGLWMHIESLTTGHSYTKLVASLVILAKRFGRQEKNGIVIGLKMNEHDLANYSGITRETASRELQKLKKENSVSFEKGILIVHNLDKLENVLLG